VSDALKYETAEQKQNKEGEVFIDIRKELKYLTKE